VRRRELDQNDTEGQKHFGANDRIAQKLEVLRQLLCEGKMMIKLMAVQSSSRARVCPGELYIV
jgi:hypothetical protein